MEKHKEYYEDKIEVMDYINVIWKRKWQIIVPTFILVVIVGIISFVLPEVWEVETIVLPAKFIVQTPQGSFKEEVVVMPASQIANKIKKGAYNQLIASELNLDMKDFPGLKTEVLEETDLIQITSRDQDVEKLKSIHLALYNYVQSEINKDVKEEMKSIEGKLNTAVKRKEELEKALVETRKRIEDLEKEQKLNLKKQSWREGEALGMLLYSNEIQQSLRYLDSLKELLAQKDNEINNLNKEKGRIHFTQLAKEPTSSLNPVAPNKKLNIVIAGLFGIFIFTILAFFIEYIQKHKLENKGK